MAIHAWISENCTEKTSDRNALHTNLNTQNHTRKNVTYFISIVIFAMEGCNGSVFFHSDFRNGTMFFIRNFPNGRVFFHRDFRNGTMFFIRDFIMDPAQKQISVWKLNENAWISENNSGETDFRMENQRIMGLETHEVGSIDP